MNVGIGSDNIYYVNYHDNGIRTYQPGGLWRYGGSKYIDMCGLGTENLKMTP